jgi:DNA-binding response OmpR family regulator
LLGLCPVLAYGHHNHNSIDVDQSISQANLCSNSTCVNSGSNSVDCPTVTLSNLKADYYDLLLLDLHLPQMNGLELCQEIKKKDKNLNACFVTSYQLYYESLKKEYPNLNLGCFISKAFDMNYLVNKIKKELASGGN